MNGGETRERKRDRESNGWRRKREKDRGRVRERGREGGRESLIQYTCSMFHFHVFISEKFYTNIHEQVNTGRKITPKEVTDERNSAQTDELFGAFSPAVCNRPFCSNHFLLQFEDRHEGFLGNLHLPN